MVIKPTLKSIFAPHKELTLPITAYKLINVMKDVYD